MRRIGLAVIAFTGAGLILLASVNASAGAEAPALPPLRVVVGSQPFSEAQLLSGTSASPETCSHATGAFWVVDNGRGDCIRTYQSGFANGSNSRVIVFFHGDLIAGIRGKTPVTLEDPRYPRSTPNQMQASTDRFAKAAAFPFVQVGRPGAYGWSGDHLQRRRPREVRLINAALDALKAIHAVQTFYIAGQSGGGHNAAALLALRRDIACTVIASAPASTRAYNMARGFTVPPGQFFDPAEHVGSIVSSSPPRIFILGDPRDTVVSFSSQRDYFERLTRVGLPARLLIGNAEPPRHHGLGTEALLKDGRIAVGMARRGDDLQLTRTTSADGARRLHDGHGNTRRRARRAPRGERTPWRATQRAAWAAGEADGSP
jgi:pimeloyl-ACP methyl ester carboxylesterase